MITNEQETNFDQEISEILQTIENLEGKDFYTDLIKSGKLSTSPSAWRRVLREAKDLNNEFHTLRTYMGAVSDTMGILHFLIYPADGAFADKPLCGRVLIPATYPQYPPVVHLLTKTGRYNVDVYSSYSEKAYLSSMHSSMCFDILKPVSSGGLWKEEYTISCLMQLIQSIVSLKVPQTHGGELDEFVTMEKLDYSSRAVEEALGKYEKLMPSKQAIKKVEAAPLKSKVFDFPYRLESSKRDENVVVYSQPIKLQVPDELKSQEVYSIGLNLSGLQVNPQTVFSIVLTNDPNDLVGKKANTVLVRNGVTASAAKKVKNGKTNWFYHGKPMNQSDLKLIVTVGYDQFCISYIENGKVIVHGDCPVSFLTQAEIGNVSNQRFYLSILMKNKNAGKQVVVETFVPEHGYLHPIFGGIPQDPSDIKKEVEESKIEEDGKPNWDSVKLKSKEKVQPGEKVDLLPEEENAKTVDTVSTTGENTAKKRSKLTLNSKPF